LKQEKRKVGRREIRQLAYLDLGTSNGGVLLTLSEEGCSFKAIAPLQDPKTYFAFITGDGYEIKGEAQVTWLDATRKIGGLRFVDLPTDFRTNIRLWMEKIGYPAHSNANYSSGTSDQVDDFASDRRKPSGAVLPPSETVDDNPDPQRGDSQEASHREESDSILKSQGNELNSHGSAVNLLADEVCVELPKEGRPEHNSSQGEMETDLVSQEKLELRHLAMEDCLRSGPPSLIETDRDEGVSTDAESETQQEHVAKLILCSESTASFEDQIKPGQPAETCKDAHSGRIPQAATEGSAPPQFLAGTSTEAPPNTDEKLIRQFDQESSKTRTTIRVGPSFRRNLKAAAVIAALVGVIFIGHRWIGNSLIWLGSAMGGKKSSSEILKPGGYPPRGAAHIGSHLISSGEVSEAEELKSLWSDAQKGDSAAQLSLADHYARGAGVSKDCVQARVLISLAALKGSDEARQMLTEGIRNCGQ
jgi:hypothetical protein